MATTSIMPLHTGKGQTMKRALLQNKKARDTLSRAFLRPMRDFLPGRPVVQQALDKRA